MYSNNYTLGFVFIVTLVLGTMLSFTKDSVKSLQDQNLKADVQKTILRSLNFEENLLERIVYGLDDVDMTLKFKDKIASFEQERKQEKPWIFSND